MRWGTKFALLAKYYGFSPENIAHLTPYQFNMYVSEIANVEKIYSGEGGGESRAGSSGGYVPTHHAALGNVKGQVPTSQGLRAMAREILKKQGKDPGIILES